MGPLLKQAITFGPEEWLPVAAWLRKHAAKRKEILGAVRERLAALPEPVGLPEQPEQAAPATVLQAMQTMKPQPFAEWTGSQPGGARFAEWLAAIPVEELPAPT